MNGLVVYFIQGNKLGPNNKEKKALLLLRKRRNPFGNCKREFAASLGMCCGGGDDGYTYYRSCFQW